MARATAQYFWSPPLREGTKGQISLIFNYKDNFKNCITKLNVSSHNLLNERLKHIRRDFHWVAWVMTWKLGVGGQKLDFLNMVMVHIKLKGMITRP